MFNKALAIPEISTFLVEGMFEDVIYPDGSVEYDKDYYFKFDATGNSQVFDVDNMLLSGNSALEDFTFKLTFWKADLGSSSYQNHYDAQLLPVPNAAGKITKLAASSSKDFSWDLTLYLNNSGNGGFTGAKLNWTPLGFSESIQALDFGDIDITHIKSIPEPTLTLALFALGGLGVASKLRKSNK